MSPESRSPESRPPESRERRLGSFRRLVATVRFRVTALATFVVVAMLVVTGAALVAAQARLLRENLADGVEQRADDVAALLATGRLPEVLAGGDDTLLQVTGPAGEVVAASPALSGAPRCRRPTTAGPGRDGPHHRGAERRRRGFPGPVPAHPGARRAERAPRGRQPR